MSLPIIQIIDKQKQKNTQYLKNSKNKSMKKSKRKTNKFFNYPKLKRLKIIYFLSKQQYPIAITFLITICF